MGLFPLRPRSVYKSNSRHRRTSSPPAFTRQRLSGQPNDDVRHSRTGIVNIDFTMWPLFKALKIDNILAICEIGLCSTFFTTSGHHGCESKPRYCNLKDYNDEALIRRPWRLQVVNKMYDTEEEKALRRTTTPIVVKVLQLTKTIACKWIATE
ncbi:hypothetical protein DFH94DRAFT_213535 [Russula ochroleuca]|uniref:Uncharacterized protein n=1 Tax=Russula ochroleuca TaxID=152965 RepID=A0A9P5JXX3_9AGAM|nr:hypothetical protein DFH94DRAFT_213535 [Russula ochroleuca]